MRDVITLNSDKNKVFTESTIMICICHFIDHSYKGRARRKKLIVFVEQIIFCHYCHNLNVPESSRDSHETLKKYSTFQDQFRKRNI